MKTIISSLLFLFCTSGLLFAQDTLYLYYDIDWKEISKKDEAVYYRKAFQTNKNEWMVNDYFISNKIQMTGTYKSKKLTVKNGHFIYYAENGNKISEGNYVNDKLNGLWTYWHENGQIKSQGTYVDNQKTGIWNYWNEKNNQTGRETYKKAGFGSIEGFFENGVKNYEGNFSNLGPEGSWTYWNIDGRISLKGNFISGLRHGEWTRYFRDGEVKIIYNLGFQEGSAFGGIVRNQ